MVLEKGKPRVCTCTLGYHFGHAARPSQLRHRIITQDLLQARRATEPPSASFDMHTSIEIAANKIAIVTDYICHTHPMM